MLFFTALATALPSARASMLNIGPHGFTEVLYAYTSNVTSNGSAMAGLSGNTLFYNLSMTAAMLIGRYLPIALLLALAGTLATQRPRAITAAMLRAEGATIAVLIGSSAVILALLTFIPALSLGAIATVKPY